MERPRTRLAATVLGAPDPGALASFYAHLLGWRVVEKEPDWVRIKPDDGGPGLSFQYEADFRRPVWPESPDGQQMMMHLDIAVDDLDTGVAWALSAGAVLAEYQPQDNVRVLFDPAGHPFDLFRDGT